jgi:hypothetical protein
MDDFAQLQVHDLENLLKGFLVDLASPGFVPKFSDLSNKVRNSVEGYTNIHRKNLRDLTKGARSAVALNFGKTLKNTFGTNSSNTSVVNIVRKSVKSPGTSSSKQYQMSSISSSLVNRRVTIKLCLSFTTSRTSAAISCSSFVPLSILNLRSAQFIER